MEEKPYIIATNDVRDICIECDYLGCDEVNVLTMNLKHSGSSIGDIPADLICKFVLYDHRLMFSKNVKCKYSLEASLESNNVDVRRDSFRQMMNTESFAIMLSEYEYDQSRHAVYSTDAVVMTKDEAIRVSSGACTLSSIVA